MHIIFYFAFGLILEISTQPKDPRRELGISLFSYLSFLKFWEYDHLILFILSSIISITKIWEGE